MKSTNAKSNDLSVEERMRAPGGLSREECLQRAESNLEQIRPTLSIFVQLQLDNLLDTMKHLATQDSDRRHWLDLSIVACEGLRDCAPAAGSRLLGQIAGTLCEHLETHVATPELLRNDVVACFADALTMAHNLPYRDKSADDFPELMAGLARITETGQASSQDV